MGLWERLHPDEVTVGEAVEQAKVTGMRESPPEVWGRPNRCPQCGGVGYLEGVDLVHRVQHQHCTECFHKWSTAEADTLTAG
jgi:hypothetical protein